jgi:glyoxylase-like metal-dependent hydrolase (beta-lactamase superfamily II)
MLGRALGLTAALLMAAPVIAAPEAQRLDSHTLLVPGGFEPGRQPDGNSLIVEGTDGLLVFDTGRHPAHSDAILAAAKALGKPVTVIVNSHWHLDHVSGNLPLRAAFPGLRVYASDAIDGALTGFLKDSAEEARKMLAANQLDPAMAAEVRGDIATFEAGAGLRPDVVVSGDRPLRFAGRKLALHLVHKAATAGDVWLYDAQTRRAIVGDLVTLPVPFLDTACPEGWAAALRRIDALDFTSLVPGHGPVMSHADFRLWKSGFDAFVDCANDDRPLKTCSADWQSMARHFLAEGEAVRAAGMADYYGNLVRSRKLAKYC